jgi:alkyl hydroperoxide reductase subunit AhpF
MADQLLNDAISIQIREVFQGLAQPVAVLFFGQQTDCEYCTETRQLLEEVCALSPLLHLEVHDREQDTALAQQYHVDKTPLTILAAKDGVVITDFDIRFAGIPMGSEFTSLINSLIMVSRRDSGLQQATRDFLKTLTAPVSLQVFVTPT